MTRFRKKLRALWRRRQLHRDLRDELKFHLEMKTGVVGDLPEARRLVGNLTALEESCRDLWSFSALESWWSDLRYALRMLGKSPGFTAVAVITLALGIGADTAVFTIARGAFSWDLGLDHVAQTILLGLADHEHHQDLGASYPDFRFLRSQAKSLAGLAAYRFSSANLSDSRALPERFWCATVSANAFAVSEQQPLLGRTFLREDERPGAPPVVVLAYHLWQDRYGKDPQILGKDVRVNDVPRSVIGVLPPGKRFPEEADLWTPLIPDPALDRRDSRSLTLFGRLQNGVSMAAARSELNALAARLSAQYPAASRSLVANVTSIGEITGAYNMRPLFATLWFAVGFVLLIACADVANMLLARGAGRMREISIRVAIGAGRARIVRQLLVESVLLSLSGGCLGWFVAQTGLHWFDSGVHGVKPVWLNLSLDAHVFLYLAAISLLTGILFGLAPAWRLAAIDVHSAMKDGGHGVAGERRVLAVSNFLVILEMALSVVLLAGAGLMVRSIINLYAAPLGVNISSVLTMRLNLPEAKYALPSDQLAFHRALRGKVQGLPGVVSAGIASNLPLGRWLSFPYQLEGGTVDSQRAPRLGAIVASPGYFQALRIKPLVGRVFLDTDGLFDAPVVLVNESFARQFWPRQIALGKRLRLFKDHAAQPWLTVVGIVPDVLQNPNRPLEHHPLIYLPFSQQPQREMFIVARIQSRPAPLVGAFRRRVRSIDPNLPLYDVATLENRLAQNRLSVTLLGAMFAIFAGIALLLAAIGLYAVMAHSISRRIQEIGVRMALGSTRSDVLRLVYIQAMRPLLLGLLVGLPIAFAVSRVLRRILVGVSPNDPLSFSLAVLVLCLAGTLGCALPAYRATRVDPIVALRYE